MKKALLIVGSVFILTVAWFSISWVKDIRAIEYIRGKEHAITEAQNIFNGKVNALKNDLVYQIKDCETSNFKEDDGVIVFDTNKKASIGLWQFQIDTVIYYYKKLYSKDITRKEAILIALDEERSAELTERIIFETEGGYKNWAICSDKKKVVSQLAIIKKVDGR
jgi:hypothetical protein